METPPKGKSLRTVSFSAHAARGLIRERGARRKLMWGAVATAAALALLGATLFQDFLHPRQHPLRFILFWLACGWMTVLGILLALFDLLIVRAQARAARKALGDP